MNIYGIYVRADGQGRIVAVNSEGILPDLTGWVRVGEYKSKEPYAQGDALGGPIMTDDGAYRYKLLDGQVVERSPEEMDADVLPEEPPMTVQALLEKIDMLEVLLANQQVTNDMLTECLLEMSEVVYAGK